MPMFKPSVYAQKNGETPERSPEPQRTAPENDHTGLSGVSQEHFTHAPDTGSPAVNAGSSKIYQQDSELQASAVDSTQIVVVTVAVPLPSGPFDDQDAVAPILSALLLNDLASNVFSRSSSTSYAWKGKIVTRDEVILDVMTTPAKASEVVEVIRANHPDGKPLITQSSLTRC